MVLSVRSAALFPHPSQMDGNSIIKRKLFLKPMNDSICVRTSIYLSLKLEPGDGKNYFFSLVRLESEISSLAGGFGKEVIYILARKINLCALESREVCKS